MQIRHGALALAVTAALSAQAFGDSKAASGRMRTAARPSNARAHFRFPAHARAVTESVLYDQSGVAVIGAPVQDFQSSFDQYDSEGADDFVVTDTAGWTVSAFNFQMSYATRSGAMPPPPDAVYDVAVYEDASGSPGVAACSYSGLSGTLDPTDTSLSISLTSPCALPQGTYWVALQAVFDFAPQAFWSNDAGAALGNEAVWREAGGFGTICTTWTPMPTCAVGGSHPNFLFQVVGSVGSAGACAPGGICLATTAGTDLAPDACGSADTIDAVVGDQLNFCYTVTNGTGVALDYQTLQNNVDGTIFAERAISLPPGGSVQYNVIETVGVSNTWTSTWTAQDVPSGYGASIETGGGNCSDRIFADGFETPGPGCPGSSFIDITATGTPLGIGDDDESSVTMPFSFDFYGNTSNLICVDNNGLVLFGVTCPNLFLFENAPLPSALPAPAIMPLWDDFDSESGGVFTDTRGAPPNRQFIVEWFDRVHYKGSSNTDGATFEVIFNEDGTLQFEYADVDYTAFANPTGDPDDCSMGICATIGLESEATLYNQFSAFEASVTDGSGIRWTATTPQIFTSTDAVTVNVGSPQMVVNPDPLAGSGLPGANGTIPFAIENHGDRDLVWTLDEAAPANFHFPPPGTRYAVPLGDPAKASAGRAPLAERRPHKNGASAMLHARLASGTTFAQDLYGDQFESFDIQNPGAVDTIASGQGHAFVGGAFVDGDYSKFYAIAGDFGADPSQFFTIDPATGALTLVGDATNNLVEGYTGLSWDGTSGTMYAASSVCGSSSHLWTIDRASGAPAAVGEITGASCIVAIAVDAAGDMYGLDVASDALYAIDKSSGNAALIGSIGFNANYAQDMAFDLETGVLYLAGFDADAFTDSIYTVDLQTGAASLVAPIGSSFQQVDAMSTETVGGPCTQPEDLPWLSIDHVAGTTAPGGSSPVTATIDGTGTIDGDIRTGTICARSNDPQKHVVEVPIQYTFAAPPPPAPSLTKSFEPSTIAPNQTSKLTIALANGAASDALLTTPLTDNLPPGMTVATPVQASTTCGGAVLTSAQSITLAGGSTIPAGGSCTVEVDVTVGVTGTFDNLIPAGALATNTGFNAAPATATLTAHIPPTISKAFNPSTVAVDTPSTLTITIVDSDLNEPTLTADLVDTFPPGLVVAPSPNGITTCSGTITANAGTGSITLGAGAGIPPPGCTISVDVVASAAGAYANDIPAGALKTDFGTNATSADATLDVN